MISGKAWMLGLLALLAVSVGCRRPTVAERDEQERQDPAIQAAWRAAEAGDRAGAVSQYEAILRERPDLARAHLDLAMLLLAAEEKPVKAIYHFMRFQELRPDSEKRELIVRQIWYLTGLISSKASQSRIALLQQKLAAAEAEIQAIRQGKPSAQPAGPAASSLPRAYVVQPGDTLIRIALKVYGDGSKARGIFEANRSRLKSVNALQVGQALVIPP